MSFTIQNNSPVATDDSATTAEDSGAAAIDVLANDDHGEQASCGDSLGITGVAQSTNGTVTITGGGTGLTYQPDPDFSGTDSFTYTVTDSFGDSETATVNVDVTAVNDPPVASDNFYSVKEDKVLTVRLPGVLGNDTDLDGDALAASLVSGPQKARLTLNADGSFAYKPKRNFHGTDSFVYEARDGQGGTDTATATIKVRSRPG